MDAKETEIVLKTMKTDDHDGLRMPSDLIISGWKKRLK